jgi:hypothetical protein
MNSGDGRSRCPWRRWCGYCCRGGKRVGLAGPNIHTHLIHQRHRRLTLVAPGYLHGVRSKAVEVGAIMVMGGAMERSTSIDLEETWCRSTLLDLVVGQASMRFGLLGYRKGWRNWWSGGCVLCSEAQRRARDRGGRTLLNFQQAPTSSAPAVTRSTSK